MLGLGRRHLGRRTPSTASVSQQQAPNDDLKVGSLFGPATMVSEKAASQNGSPIAASIATKAMSNGVMSNGAARTNVDFMIKTSESQLTLVQKTASHTRYKTVRELPDINDGFFDDMDIERFLDYTTDQRVMNVPDRGSQWDKVLNSAEYFGLQLQAYGEMLEKFAHESMHAVNIALGSCRLLLELGHQNAAALSSSFTVFSKIGRSLSPLLRNDKLFTENHHTHEELASIFANLLELISDVAIYYRKRVNDVTAGAVVIDFHHVFGRNISAIYKRKDRAVGKLWSYKLGHGSDHGFQSLTTWLSPRDHIIRAIASDRLESKNVRADYTCEWSQRFLRDFLLRSKDHTLVFTGPPGCGKSVLSGFIEERLQRPLGPKSYETVYYAIESDIPSEATSFALVRNLLLQLLERNIGDVKLYTRLLQAYGHSKTTDASGLEEELWQTLHASIASMAESKANLVFIVDGLDEVVGGETAAIDIFNRLRKALQHQHTIRSIILSRQIPFGSHKDVRELSIRADHVRDDIGRLVKASLKSHPHYKDRSNQEKDKIIDHFLDTAKGSFIWTVLALKIVATENSHKGFLQAVEEVPNSLQEAIKKLMERLDLNKYESKHIFSWLAVAARPLTLEEIDSLLKADVHKRGLTERATHIQDEVSTLCGFAVYACNGILRFRHRTIRDFIVQQANQNKSFMSLPSTHSDMATRALLYVAHGLRKRSEISFETLEASTLNDIFHSHVLMQYAVSYWTYHLRRSSMCKDNGHLDLSSEFKAIFPSSSFITLVEWSCWSELQLPLQETIGLFELALSVRQSVFGAKHESTLQTMIVLAAEYRKVENLEKASFYFYRASSTSQLLLGKYSIISVTCTEHFLVCTEAMAFTSRTEIFTYREHMLRYIIEVGRHRHGETSDIVIQHYKILASLYASIHEDHFASEIYHILYQIIVKKYGKTSEEANKVFEDLTVVLSKEKEQKGIVGFERSIFETYEETLDIWDIRRIQVTIRLALALEFQGDVFRAEELFVNLWLRITEICRGSKDIGIHIAKIDVAIAYFQFLQKLNRKDEALSILICIWSEYEHDSHGSEIIIIRLKSIGELFKSVGFLSIAISIFTSVWSFFKRVGKSEHAEATSVITLISETVEEEITTTSTTVIKEEVIKEVFEITFTRCKITKEYTELVKACNALVAYFIQLEKYTEAIETIYKSLEVSWKVVVTGEGTLTLPNKDRTEIGLMVHHLAVCYHKKSQFELAERFYLRLYRAYVASLHVDDERIGNACLTLVNFYEEHHRHDKAIEIYVELLKLYRAGLAAKHNLTIKLLYTLGSMCLKYGRRKEGYSYYAEIFTILNAHSNVCHHDAIHAAIILIDWYYQEKRWKELRETCAIAWEAFVCGEHQHYQFNEEMILTIYRRYYHVLEVHFKMEYAILYKISVQFRDTSVKLFGASALLVITALIELAKVCEKHEEHYHEALTIYEEILTRKTTISTTTITEVRRRLTRTYITIIRTKGSSITTIEKAIKVLNERFLELKLQFGCWHESTLAELRELVLLYRKLDTKESRITVMQLLRTAVIEIITKTTVAGNLYQAAIQLGKTYLACELTEHGIEILRQLRYQLILHDASGCSFTLDPSVGRPAYVFLVAFEVTLRGDKRLSYPEAMAELLEETMLYEQLRLLFKRADNAHLTIRHGARLLLFLATRKRELQLEILNKQLFDTFIKSYGSSFTTKESVTMTFFFALVQELGKEHTHSQNMGRAACIVGSEKVKALIEEDKFQEAYDVALCAFQFIRSHRYYHDSQNFGYGWKLSLYLAGRNVRIKHDNKVHSQMLELSRDIIREVLSACKEANISMVQVKLEDLENLIDLLGAQKNYVDLEGLLAQLWNSRSVQKTWSRSLIINLGGLYVQAMYCNSHHAEAIRLCENICHNLRRAIGFGPLHPTTLRLSRLLSALYTGDSRHRDAMAVHEEILRSELDNEYEKGDEGVLSESVETVRENLEWLKRTYQRLGEWDKSEAMYRSLYTDLDRRYGAKLNVQPVDKWIPKGADSVGTYAPPALWSLNERVPQVAIEGQQRKGPPEQQPKGEQLHTQNGGIKPRKRSLLERARASWGFSNSREHLHPTSVAA